MSVGCVHHQDAFTVAGNPKTSYFRYVMMATGFLVIWILVVVVVRCCLSCGCLCQTVLENLHCAGFHGSQVSVVL